MQTLRFVRHGATAPNLAGLRCGGDLDVPLTDTGRQQARAAAQHIAGLGWHIGLVITSDLKRTSETASIIAKLLGGVEVLTEPAFAERRLGQWNLLPIADSQPWLEARLAPPGGEAHEAFAQRILGAAQALLPCLARRPLLVGSKGVARVLGELCQGAAPNDRRPALANGGLLQFDLSTLTRRASATRPCA